MIRIFRPLQTACVLLLLLGHAPGAAADDPVRIGWTPWADGVFVTRLAERLIEDELGREVERMEAPISEQYQGIADGRIDVMLMSWQPATHAPFLDRIGNRVEHLGALYDDARLGWAVPDYVPEDRVDSIADLANHADAFDQRVVGIDPDAGLTRLSQAALGHYQLDDFELVTSSGPEMTERLAAAVDREEWVVVTAWNPHWIFAAHDLRYLRDPDATLGGAERVHALARSGFYADEPEVARLLTRMYLDLPSLEQALLIMEQGSESEAVTHYLDHHPEHVDYWLGRTASR